MSDIQDRLEGLYKQEAGKLLAYLTRMLGDLQSAEDVLQEAFQIALTRWPQDGIPDNPTAWLATASRNKALDLLRHSKVVRDKGPLLAAWAGYEETTLDPYAEGFPDERLRLIFTCCHPALNPETQVALTLHTVCGLRTEEIAAAFLLPVPTLAQRLVRGKRKIKTAGIPYEVPGQRQLQDRLQFVLVVIYLVFNAGYEAERRVDNEPRMDLCREAIRLGRLVNSLLPEIPEARGLLSLMLLHDARRPARINAAGELLTLEEQDRDLWHQEQIAEGVRMLEGTLSKGEIGEFQLQAAIAALHCQSPTPQQTDWPQIVALYRLLHRINPSPVIALNLAVAVGMAQGPEKGLNELAALEDQKQLKQYALLPAAQADFLRRLGRDSEAKDAYRRAIELTDKAVERQYYQRRMDALKPKFEQ